MSFLSNFSLYLLVSFLTGSVVNADTTKQKDCNPSEIDILTQALNSQNSVDTNLCGTLSPPARQNIPKLAQCIKTSLSLPSDGSGPYVIVSECGKGKLAFNAPKKFWACTNILYQFGNLNPLNSTSECGKGKVALNQPEKFAVCTSTLLKSGALDPLNSMSQCGKGTVAFNNPEQFSVCTSNAIRTEGLSKSLAALRCGNSRK